MVLYITKKKEKNQFEKKLWLSKSGNYFVLNSTSGCVLIGTVDLKSQNLGVFYFQLSTLLWK